MDLWAISAGQLLRGLGADGKLYRVESTKLRGHHVVEVFLSDEHGQRFSCRLTQEQANFVHPTDSLVRTVVELPAEKPLRLDHLRAKLVPLSGVVQQSRAREEDPD